MYAYVAKFNKWNENVLVNLGVTLSQTALMCYNLISVVTLSELYCSFIVKVDLRDPDDELNSVTWISVAGWSCRNNCRDMCVMADSWRIRHKTTKPPPHTQLLVIWLTVRWLSAAFPRKTGQVDLFTFHLHLLWLLKRLIKHPSVWCFSTYSMYILCLWWECMLFEYVVL